MLGVHELLKMKGLQTETIEEAAAILAALVLALPIELPSLLGGEFHRLWPFGLFIDGTTVLAQGYTYDGLSIRLPQVFMLALASMPWFKHA